MKAQTGMFYAVGVGPGNPAWMTREACDVLGFCPVIAAPKNAQRLERKTPCAIKGDRCYDCKSPERICRSLVVLWGPSNGVETEVVLVDEDLGL